MSDVIGVGVDLCAVGRIARAIEKERFVLRVYTEEERAYLEARGAGRAQSAAALFAAKEAVAKALGTGFSGGVAMREISVGHDGVGAPHVTLSGAALERMRELGGERVLLSLTHEDGTAAAFAVMTGNRRGEVC